FSVGSIELCQLGQVSIAILRCACGCLKQLCGTLGERTLQAAVTSLALDELFVVRSGSLGVQRERVLTLCLLARIEAEVVPVAGLNRTLHLVLAVGHTALNTVHLAGCITDDEGRAVIALSLSNGLDGLVLVCAHRNLCHINVAIAHSDLSQALLADGFTSRSKLSNLTDLAGLGSLTGGVGVNLSIEYHHVDVFAGSQN